ncbi:peptide ligase PGM1-related protein [Streptomyces sp. NPDC049577]|uniref:preATP grasp domain-containing protein n=1 Tax=Streptomyces sp. NPDC049577 TaxID=3155153 RepID=UPI003426F6B3
MAGLLVGNDFTEELDGADAPRQATARWYAKRALFFARDGDVLVLPERPDDGFVRYVTSLTGTDPATLRTVVPPRREMLSAALFADPAFRARVREALRGRTVERVVMFHPDAAVVDLARALGLLHLVPGHAFIGQGGGALVNSKAVFRALAAGAGAPVPDGAVCADAAAAEQVIGRLFDEGRPVITKQEFRQAGKGNEILSRTGGVTPRGAPRVVVLPDGRGLRRHLAAHWSRLTDGGRHRLVVERYFPDATSVFAEFLLTDEGIRPAGDGELLYAPTPIGQIMPVQSLDASRRAALIAGGHRICEPLHAMGYRGTLSADGIVTPSGDLWFTEFNGRITGSTHVYEVIGDRVVGEDYPAGRVLLEHVGWRVPSFAAAVRRLADAGLAYDRRGGTGVIVDSAFDPAHRDVVFCVVAKDLPGAEACRRRVLELFADA